MQVPEKEYVPLWSNLDLPQQDYSWVAHAAYINRWNDADVPMPSAFKMPAPKRRDGDETTSTYRIPVDPQTKLVYDAFLSLSTVTIMQEESDVMALVVAEKAEFKAAVGQGDTDPMAAPPRRYAMTLLIPQSRDCNERHQLLDCMALLSRAAGEAQACPARVVRMSVLTDRDAVYYADKAGHHALVGFNNHAELALTYGTDDGKRVCKFLTLEHTNLSSKQMFKMLTKAVAQLFKDSELDVLPLLARSCLSSSHSIDGAYRLGMKEANVDFWSLVSVHDKEPPIDYRLEFGPDGNREHRVFLKIVPKIDMAHTHPEVYFGMLVYKEDTETILYNYAVAAMQEERANQPAAPNTFAFGLRPPTTTNENACRPHVLTVRADVVSLRGQVSCFGLRGAPGAEVSFYENCSVPRLLYTLEPFNEEFRAGKYVFPCTQDQTDSKDWRYEEAQWDAAMDGFRKYAYVCNVADDPPEEQGVADSPFHIKKRKSAPSGEDKVLAEMVGIPIGSAYRLGDVYEQMALVKQRVPVLASFLTASIARLGPNASMAEALQVCVRLEEERVALSAQVEQLREEMQAVAEAAEAAPPPPTTSASASASAPAEIAPCSFAQAEKLLLMMNLRTASGTPLKLPLTTNRCIGIVRVLARANLSSTADESAAEAHAQECKDMGVVEAASYLVAALYAVNVYVVVVREGGSEVDVVRGDDDGRKLAKVTPLEMMEATDDASAPPLLLKFDEQHSKLFALVPKA